MQTQSKEVGPGIKHRTAAKLAVLALLLTSCGGGTPSATEGSWSLAPETNGKAYIFDASFRLHWGKEGWFTPQLLMTDDRGCQRLESFPAVIPFTMPNPDNFQQKFHERIETKLPIVRVRLTLIFRPDGASPSDTSVEKTVFSEEKVLDSSVQPVSAFEACKDTPGTHETPNERRARLRKMAETDPDGADAEAIDSMGRNELMATAINSAGFLCARVTEMHPSGRSIDVSCVEYRNGSGRVKYRVDPSSGSVEQL